LDALDLRCASAQVEKTRWMQSQVSRAEIKAGLGKPPQGAWPGSPASVQAMDKLQYRQSPS
jgi:hypothetical protein